MIWRTQKNQTCHTIWSPANLSHNDRVAEKIQCWVWSWAWPGVRRKWHLEATCDGSSWYKQWREWRSGNGQPHNEHTQPASSGMKKWNWKYSATHVSSIMSFLQKRDSWLKSPSRALLRFVEQTEMQIIQFFCVMIGTFGSAIKNKWHVVIHQPTQISGIAAVAKPQQRRNLRIAK